MKVKFKGHDELFILNELQGFFKNVQHFHSKNKNELAMKFFREVIVELSKIKSQVLALYVPNPLFDTLLNLAKLKGPLPEGCVCFRLDNVVIWSLDHINKIKETE